MRGFTLIELVCVLIIIAAFAAMAIPRFLDMSDEAARVAVARHAHSFAQSVQLVRAVHSLKGRSGNVDNLPGFGNGNVDTNASGYPTDTANANAIPNNNNGANRCRNVFNGILSSPAPVCGGSLACTSAHVFRAVTVAAQTCRFLYLKDPDPARYFTYSASSGAVAETNP
jgi:MSHA pilin protein MshB